MMVAGCCRKLVSGAQWRAIADIRMLLGAPCLRWGIEGPHAYRALPQMPSAPIQRFPAGPSCFTPCHPRTCMQALTMEGMMRVPLGAV